MNVELLQKKIADSKAVVRDAFAKYPGARLRVAWTGGKDSTLVLWLVRAVCQEDGHPLPACFCIDEGDMFPEIREFLDTYTRAWNVQLELIHNHDVSRAAGGTLGGTVRVADLDARNQAEIQRLGYEEDTFVYEPESYVGNHLMKTATMNRYLEEHRVAAFLVGIRWDEQEARMNETYISPRPASDLSPAHDRVHPILHFTERDVWDAHQLLKIPYSALYEQGYRSLGARVTTTKASVVPAWEQDLENTSERGGRRQDKENLMAKLRSLGYM